MAENELFKAGLNRAMALCARREYCRSEILAKLEAWGIEYEDGIKIVGLLIRENFINEERFATSFVKDKFKYNKWGKIKISSHLRAKNIPGDLIKTAFESIDEDLYRKTLSDLIASHRRGIKAKNQYDLKARLLRFGLSRGFESSLLYDLLNEIED
jgi:regulatory protein